MKTLLRNVALVVIANLCVTGSALAADNPGPGKPSPGTTAAAAKTPAAGNPLKPSAATASTSTTSPVTAIAPTTTAPNVIVPASFTSSSLAPSSVGPSTTIAANLPNSATASTVTSATLANVTRVRVKDITTIEGVRENPLVGYGLVVGLNGTGDRQQTIFSTQTLSNILQRMGVQVAGNAIRVNNVAAVFVTANLPAFARPGMQLDVTVSSIGDAKSLEGGMLLLTPLTAANGQTYAVAQGPTTLGGYSAGGGGNTKIVNHPTVGRIPSGAIVEKPLAVDLTQMPTLSFLLRSADFATARDLALAVNQTVGKPIARAVDSRRIEISTIGSEGTVTDLLALVQETMVSVHSSAKVVVNERTGTVVMGQDVQLGAVSILHGNLEIEVKTELKVSQPGILSNGQTTVVPETTVKAQESPARRIELKQGATVEDLVRGLQAIGATARDIVAILQAIKEANALHADLEVI
jgi:flagellar P-ring protein precursor FlgI